MGSGKGPKAKQLLASWYADKPLSSFPLKMASWLFTFIAFMRRVFYRVHLLDAYRIKAPVIVIGNITVGGTGKTPLVIALAKALDQAGFKVGIVSRGYGADIPTPTLVSDRDRPEHVGDEPAMMARHLPNARIIVGKDRVISAKKLVSDHGCDVIISDDGLQHYRLKRDIEVAVIDGARGVGNGARMPRGPLRESIARLKKVDHIVVNGELTAPAGLSKYITVSDSRLRCAEKSKACHCERSDAIFSQFARRLRHFVRNDKLCCIQKSLTANSCTTMHLQPDWQLLRVDGADKRMPVSELLGHKVYAVAGIGNPDRFFGSLREKGLSVAEHPFSDHYMYTKDDINVSKDEWVVMTEKDAVKCLDFADDRHWYLAVTAVLPDVFIDLIVQQIRSKACEKV
jgi:tetraacyldisaccharide 4'-kinase